MKRGNRTAAMQHDREQHDRGQHDRGRHVRGGARHRPNLGGALAAAALALLAAAGGSAADGLDPGSYLAGVSARAHDDFAPAAEYFTRALQADPDNAALMEGAMRAQVGLGRLDLALPLAQRLQAAGVASEVAAIVQVEELARAAEWPALAERAGSGRLRLAPVVGELVRGWAEIGAGRMSEGLALFERLSGQRSSAGLGLYNQALALAQAGDFEAAEAILSGRDNQPPPLSRRGVLTHAVILARLDRRADAAGLLHTAFGDNLDPGMARLAEALAGGEEVALPVATAQDGVAEVLYTVAATLSGNGGRGFALAFSRAAEFLQPGNYDAALLSAAQLEGMGRYDLAIATYDRIPRDSDHAYLARLGRAMALRRADRGEEAIAAFQRLAQEYDRNPAAFVLLGDALRGSERFTEAAEVYDRAIALYDSPDEADWTLFFSRGISHERAGDWDLAEADLRMALQLEPGQPQVLNYLGYSFIDQNRKLDEALAMIEQAVKAMPDDGYITDSLGWAFYRLGRYREAAQVMERAAQLTPLDPVINDHLGDVLWAVGRHREADFQWKRALSFAPEEKDAARIRRKLAVGLDAVLREEGAPPLAVSAR